MPGSTTPDQFTIPSSREGAVNYIETPRDAVDTAYREAIEAATARHQIDPTDVDSRRAEVMGGATVQAVTAEQATPELFFDPTDPEQLRQVGERVIAVRRNELGLAA